METVEGIPEEQSHKAICPSVSSEDIENAQFGTTEPDSGKKLKLEVGFTVKLALYVVLQHKFRELGELASFRLNVSE